MRQLVAGSFNYVSLKEITTCPIFPFRTPFELIAAPVAEPIKIPDANKQMRIEHSDYEELIERLINVAFIWA